MGSGRRVEGEGTEKVHFLTVRDIQMEWVDSH